MNMDIVEVINNELCNQTGIFLEWEDGTEVEGCVYRAEWRDGHIILKLN